MTGLKIGDVVALTYDRAQTGRIALELPDGTSCDLSALDERQAFRRIEANGHDTEDDRAGWIENNGQVDIAVNAINVGLALVASVRLECRGWGDIRTFEAIERVYGSDDEEGDTRWYAGGPRDPAESSTGRVYELTPSEDKEGIFERMFWDIEPFDGECGKVAILYVITALE